MPIRVSYHGMAQRLVIRAWGDALLHAMRRLTDQPVGVRVAKTMTDTSDTLVYFAAGYEPMVGANVRRDLTYGVSYYVVSGEFGLPHLIEERAKALMRELEEPLT